MTTIKLCMAITIILHIQCESQIQPGGTGDIFNIHQDASLKMNTDSIPLIIWWYPNLFPHFGSNGEAINTDLLNVTSGSCLVTKLRTFKDDHRTAAYIFYGTDFQVDDVPLPRLNNTLWALLHEESPMNNYVLSHGRGIRLFNITATFSRYSHYPLTSQFIVDKDYLLSPPVYSLKEKNELMRDEDLAPVLYLQSHCGVPSDRDRYVKQLMKDVQIDSYGKCLHNKDMPTSIQNTSTFLTEKLMKFISRYKFHIAFENALCNDYITEKVFRSLHVGSVPIYLGSKTIQDWEPNNISVIHAQDFESPKDLAEYIKYLNNNDNEYQKYLSYKNYETWNNTMLVDNLNSREWFVNTIGKLDFIQGFEKFVCTKVIEYNKATLIGSMEILSPVNSSHMSCPQPHVSLDVEDDDIDKEWKYYDWENIYWNGLDDAVGLEKMIHAGETNSENIFKYMKYV